jgi:hypothetical protein
VITVPRPGDRAHALDRHEEGPGRVALGQLHAVQRAQQREDRGLVLAPQRLQRGAADDRGVDEAVQLQQLADLELDQLEHLGVGDVDLVEEDDELTHAHLAGQEHVLPRLRLRPLAAVHEQDRGVHLRGAGDHVLDVVGVAGAVDVGVVALGGLVLDVGRVDRDPTLPLLGGVVDLVEGQRLRAEALGAHAGQRRGQGGLAVVDVADGAAVEVGLDEAHDMLTFLLVSLPVHITRPRRAPARRGMIWGPRDSNPQRHNCRRCLRPVAVPIRLRPRVN